MSRTVLEIRPDIAEEYGDLFGRKAINGRTLDVAEVIASLTRALEKEWDQVLRARREFLSAVSLGKAACGFAPPDLVVQLPKDLVVAAKAPDRWVDVLVDPGLKEDRYLQAIETKPTKGFRVVHHAVTSLKNDEAGDPAADADPTGNFLNEYALGKNGDVFPDGAARLIKAGTKINFNVHLHSIGQETAANVALGVKFYPKGFVPKHVELTERIGRNQDLDIPPNTDNVRSEGYTTLTKPARILSFQPHMHNRGKAQCMEAIYPGGQKVETLSCVSNYRFAWHLVYLYNEGEQPLLPAGTTLHVVSWHNNTASNKFNPDPDALVTYGQRTIKLVMVTLCYFFKNLQSFGS